MLILPLVVLLSLHLIPVMQCRNSTDFVPYQYFRLDIVEQAWGLENNGVF